ncbi:MAG: hypothetical protein ACI9IP_001706 [Arcticibacterium sp.]|jgi:hypothetical protein
MIITMKNLLIVVSFIIYSLNGVAQEVPSDTIESRAAIPVDMSDYNKSSVKFSWGIRGGLSKTRINTSSGNVYQITSTGLPVVTEMGIARDELVSSTAFGNGFQGALFGRITSGSFYLQPELIYGSKGGKFDFLDKNGDLLNRVDAKFTAVDVPILLGIRFRDARIFFGPVVSYALKKNNEFDMALAPYSNKDLSKNFFKRPILNTVIGLGFEFKSFFFDLRFERGVANYAETKLGPTSNSTPFNFTTDQFVFSVGFLK